MLTLEGCRRRRERLWSRLPASLSTDDLFLADPIHLVYLANFAVDPFSLGAGFGGLLRLRRDGGATLWHDDRLPDSVDRACVDQRVVTHWYDAQSPATGPRRLALRDLASRTHDAATDPDGPSLIATLSDLRRQKHPDEIAALRRCMRAGEAGHAWAREHVAPGMTELDVHVGVVGACTRAAGRAVVVYGDFAVSPGPERTGGPPTERVLEAGDMLILDFSVVIDGYRGDFTNTLVVGREPKADQQRLYELCTSAMAAGEAELRASRHCATVYAAVRDVFDQAGVAKYFPHHAGHGIGLSHPEAPFLVATSEEILLEGDVITLEPGLYVPGVGGIRIERNYRITADGFECLSNHAIALR